MRILIEEEERQRAAHPDDYEGEPLLVNVADEYGTTPLMLVCQYGYHEAVKLLLEAKADHRLCAIDGTDALMCTVAGRPTPAALDLPACWAI